MSTKPPPKTRSGEMPAVKTFYRGLDAFNTRIAPALDVQVDRMAALLKAVTTPPPPALAKSETLYFPKAARPPSMVDDEELHEAASDNGPDTLPAPPDDEGSTE